MPTGDPQPFPIYHFTMPPSIEVPPPVAGVLSLLPVPGTPWPEIERAKFMCALGAVLDLVYPAIDADEVSEVQP